MMNNKYVFQKNTARVYRSLCTHAGAHTHTHCLHIMYDEAREGNGMQKVRSVTITQEKEKRVLHGIF